MLFRKVEEILLDYGLGKAMNEVVDDEEVDLEMAKTLTGYVLNYDSMIT